PRTPVRGPKSREAVKVAKRAKKTAGEKQETKKVQKAIATAVEEAVEPDSPSAKRRRRRSRGASPPAEPVNAPLTFISFVSAHKLGSEVPGEVDSFSSHGAFVHVDGARCYVPLSAMGAPPPRAAREVLKRGETRTFDGVAASICVGRWRRGGRVRSCGVGSPGSRAGGGCYRGLCCRIFVIF